VVEDQGITYFLAGDTSYTQRLMLAGHVDGVSIDETVARATLGAIRHLAMDRPTVYLPTHDPESAARLANRSLVEVQERF
jgi:glyoxylase-like metal-dependent hydrolase (beta-lactamase superfamily II)